MRKELLIGIILLLSSGVFAQNKKSSQPPPPPPQEEVKIGAIKDGNSNDDFPVIDFDTTAVPNDALTTEIMKLLEITEALNFGKQFAELIMPSSQNEFDTKFRQRLLTELTQGEGKRWFELSLVRSYRKHLSLEETKQLIEFYKSPIGKKTLQILPVILQENSATGRKIGEYLGMKIYLQMKAEEANK